MKNNGLYIPRELVKKANFESNNLMAVVENGVIRIVEEDEEFCSGYFYTEDEEETQEAEETNQRQADFQTNVKVERQLLSKKGTIYLSVNLRDDLDFEVGAILELIIDGENLVVRKLDL